MLHLIVLFPAARVTVAFRHVTFQLLKVQPSSRINVDGYTVAPTEIAVGDIHVLLSPEPLKKISYSPAFDALNEKYVDMFEAGIIDPTKVTRTALQNAASVAATLLTTESIVSDIPEKEPAAPAAAPGGMGGMY